MKGFDEAVDLLQRVGTRPPGFEARFQPLQRAEGAEAVAVDGSSAVLADNAVWVVAIRARAIRWPGPPVVPEPPEVIAVTPARAADEVARRYGAHGLEPPRVRTAEALAERLRDLAEMEAAVRALRDGADLLYVDGALHGLEPTSAAMTARILETAGSTPVVGVAKSTRLAVGGHPVLPAVRAVAPDGAWFLAVPGHDDVHVARLHPSAQHIFRVDGPASALPVVADHARDAVYLGYPYPLAVAHNAVAITRAEGSAIRAALAAQLARDAPEAVALLDDFHDVLDRNV